MVDLGNGIYIGVLRAMWAGKAEVVAAIATPLEQIQLMYRLYASRGTLRELFGVVRIFSVSLLPEHHSTPTTGFPCMNVSCMVPMKSYFSHFSALFLVNTQDFKGH